MNEPKYDVLCMGTAIVDCIIKGFQPEPISKTGFAARSTSLAIGGESVNQSVIASRLGLRPALVSALGTDGAGSFARTLLEQEGISTELVVSHDGPTPVTVMFVDEAGNRKSITNRAHHYSFMPERHLDLLSSAKVLSLGSLFRAPFVDPEGLLILVRHANALGMTIYADTKLPNGKVLSLADLADALPYIDYMFPNEDEAAYYSKKERPEEMADVFLSYGVRHIIIKLGGKGCFYKSADRAFFLPACRVEAIDATGAGDNFAAAFITAKLEGRDELSALRFATACAALSTTTVGATTGVKDRDSVEQFLRAQDLAPSSIPFDR